MRKLLDLWRRRWWHPDPAALAVFEDMHPVTIVTGASQGIGYELARRFASNGHDLLLIARNPAPLAEAAQRIRAEYNVDAQVLAIDVTTPGAIESIEAALKRCNAYADILVNSAGIGLAGSFSEQSPGDLVRLIELNVRALTQLTRHFIEGMRIRGRGGILNLASLGGYAPGPYQAAYYASKAYVISLTEAVAAETAGQGVRVCTLAPGPVATSFHRRMGAENSFYLRMLFVSSAKSVARAGYLGYSLGWRVTIPGVLNPILALAMRLLPHRIVIPFIGWLLNPRGQLNSNA
jgi:short-subunit dehydrogenase